MSTQDLSGQEMMGMGAISWKSIEDAGVQLVERAGKNASEIREVVAKAALEATLKGLNLAIAAYEGVENFDAAATGRSIALKTDKWKQDIDKGIEDLKKQPGEVAKAMNVGLETAGKQAGQALVDASEEIKKGVSELIEPLSKLFPRKEEGISEDPWLYSLEAMSLVFADNQGTVAGGYEEFKQAWAQKIKDHFQDPGSDESVNAWIDQATRQKDVRVNELREVDNGVVLGRMATLVRESLESGEPVTLSGALNEAIKSLRVGGDSFGVINYAKAEELYGAYRRKLNVV